MKKILFLLVVAFFSTTFAFSQTEHRKTAPYKEKKTDKKQLGKYSDRMMYECPMKCVPATNKPGKCPKCKMDLVAVKPKQKEH